MSPDSIPTDAADGEGRGGVWPRSLALLLVGAGLVRAFAWMQTSVLFNDGPVFLAMARALGEGRFAEVVAHPYHPLYPMMIAALGGLGIDLEIAAVSVSIAGGLLAIAALFVFLDEAFDRTTALLGAWVLALHPWAVDFSSDVMSEGLYSGLYLVGFVYFARGLRSPSWRAGLGCGAAGGLAYLVRPEGAGLILLAAASMGIAALRGRDRGAARGGALAALLLAGIVVMGPYLAALGATTGDLALTQKKSLSELAEGMSTRGRRGPGVVADDSRIADSGAAPIPYPESAVRADGRGPKLPSRDAAGALEAVWRVVRTSAATLRYEVLAFAVVGLFALRSRRSAGEGLAVFLVPVLFYCGVLVLLVWGAGYVRRRHAFTFWLPWIGLAAIGWQTLWSRVTGSRQATPTVCAALAIVLVMVWGPRDLRARRADRLPTRQAAEWLASEHPGSGPVAAQKLRTAYYARAPFVPLPPGHDGRLRRILRREGARWVVIDQAKLGDHLGLSEGIGSWLRPVHEVRSGDRIIRILEVSPAPAR